MTSAKLPCLSVTFIAFPDSFAKDRAATKALKAIYRSTGSKGSSSVLPVKKNKKGIAMATATTQG
jgi:hypothetical protein